MRLPIGLTCLLASAVATEPVVAPKPTADEPRWLAVEDLVADDGVARIRLASPDARWTEKRAYVAVRGVWPIAAQRREMARALRLAETGDLVIATGFELERRVIGPPDGAEGPIWKPVAIKVAHDILGKTTDFAPEVVDPAATDSAFTMPLPERADGRWRAKAAHPRLAREKAGESKLFRYLDFDVRPGESYRYRVRLRFANPKPRTPRAAGADLYRWTEWSEPSPAVVVRP